MDARRVLGIALVVIGAGMLLFSNYIAEKVAEGRVQIAKGQSQVDTANNLFNQSQYTKPLGGFFTRGAQQRIDAGRAEVSEYAALAHKLQISGIIVLLAGIAVLFIAKKKG